MPLVMGTTTPGPEEESPPTATQMVPPRQATRSRGPCVAGGAGDQTPSGAENACRLPAATTPSSSEDVPAVAMQAGGACTGNVEPV